ncbi:AMP-binding protein [Mumia sp. DW29H23]|uniref:AMP-binding protein n=1 Tax=Mumia sp. DW29H23 TaxID=3421241 RepID=UPI003D686BDB
MPDPDDGWPSIAAMLQASAHEHADRVAVVDGDRTLTYSELFTESRRFAAALVADGVERGDRVAIWAFNSTEWIVAVLGIHQAGATLVPINTRFKGLEAGDLLRRGGVGVLVTVTDFLGTDYVDMLRRTAGDLPDLRTIVAARGPATAPSVLWSDFLDRATAETLHEIDLRRDAIGADDPADMLFTSGTTGTPKGVVATQAQTLAVAQDWARMTLLQKEDRYLMVNPYFHMFGLKAGILTSVSVGACMLPVPVFDVDAVLSAVEAEHVTVLPGPPTLYQSILDHPSRSACDLSTLRVAVTGAADIPVDLVRRIYAELPFDFVVSGYGLTEAGTAASTLPTDTPEKIATTVGTARPGFEIRVTDEFDAPVPDGDVGQILLRGPSVMSRYLDDPATTASVLTADGWLRTGDLGRVDDDGYLAIVGRTKEMFIVGGFNAYPAEIEAILMRHPAISAVAVVGVPDERLGEVGMAFVVAAEELDPAEVIAWARENMANFKVPRQVRIIDELPLNATGKVQKSALLERADSRP